MNEFCKKYDGKCQVISLGAGFDTRYYRLSTKPLKYFEIDFAEVLNEKENLLIRNGIVDIPIFVRINLDYDSFEVDVDRDYPTLVLAECILPYLRVESGDSLLRLFSTWSNCQLVAFDMINPYDSFGKQMVENLSQTYGTNMESLIRYHSLTEISNRFQELGWRSWQCKSMLDIWINEFPNKPK